MATIASVKPRWLFDGRSCSDCAFEYLANPSGRRKQNPAGSNVPIPLTQARSASRCGRRATGRSAISGSARRFECEIII